MLSNNSYGAQFVNLLYMLLFLVFIGGFLYVLYQFGYSPEYLIKFIWNSGITFLKGVI